MKIGNRRQIGILYGDNWERIYSTILTEAATSVTISGLDGDTDEEYKLIIRGVIGETDGLALRFNNDLGSNYGLQSIYAVDTTVTARRIVRTWILLNEGGSANTKDFIDMLIYAKSGYIRTVLLKSSMGSGTTVNSVDIIGGVWNNTADNITSLVIYANDTNGMIAGTVIELYKKRKKI